MKSKIALFITTLFLCFYFSMANEPDSKQNSEIKKSIEVFVSSDLNELVSGLTHSYRSKYPDVNLIIKTIAENEFADASFAKDKICIVNDVATSGIEFSKSWSIVVGREIIVPVMNAANPFFEKLNSRGISQAEFKDLLSSSGKKYWGDFSNQKGSALINVYLPKDDLIIKSVSDYIGLDKSSLKGNLLNSPDDLIAKLSSDINSIGFCRLTDVMDNQSVTKQNIKIIPIDKNANAIIDHMESFYADLYSIKRAAWIGKYPKALSEKIYVMSDVKPNDEAQLAFINWLLIDGQQYFELYGFNGLVNSEITSQLNSLNEPIVADYAPIKSKTSYWAYIVAAVVLALIGISIVYSGSRKQKMNKVYEGINDPKGFVHFDPQELVNPKGLYYDRSHTWAFMKKDGRVKIGIDNFMLNVTGAITRVEMKSPGDIIKKGDVLFSLIQKGKKLNFYSPVSGIVAEQNELLTDDSSLLNKSPFNKGWIYLIEPENWQNEIKHFSMADKYNVWIKNEYIRLKDFINEYMGQNTPQFANVILQDGGLIRKNILNDLDPKAWEEFQTKFIDTI